MVKPRPPPGGDTKNNNFEKTIENQPENYYIRVKSPSPPWLPNYREALHEEWTAELHPPQLGAGVLNIKVISKDPKIKKKLASNFITKQSFPYKKVYQQKTVFAGFFCFEEILRPFWGSFSFGSTPKKTVHTPTPRFCQTIHSANQATSRSL